MPLRAVRGEDNVLAYEMSDSEWSELKNTYKEIGLRMPCCSSLAIPKTSRLGNFFFSHQARGECTTAPESPEHIYLKTLIAKAAIESGWKAITEYRSISPAGEAWIADVYCTNGDEARVIEVQLSRQSPEEFIRRQGIYAASAVKSIWLASQYNNRRLASSPSMPIFQLEAVALDHVPKVVEFQVSVPAFIKTFLSKGLRWGVDPIPIIYVPDQCWRCRNQIFNICGWVKGGYRETSGSPAFTSQLLLRIRSHVGNDSLRALGLSVVEDVELTVKGSLSVTYSNACALCGALQNNEHLRKVLKSKREMVSEVIYRPPIDGTAHWKLVQNAT